MSIASCARKQIQTKMAEVVLATPLGLGIYVASSGGGAYDFEVAPPVRLSVSKPRGWRLLSDSQGTSGDAVACLPAWRHACSFGAVVLSAHESADRHAERSCQRRKDPLVGRFAGFQALDRTREDAGFCCQLVDGVAACNAETYDTRREWFDRRVSAVSVTLLWARGLPTFRYHRFALMHQYAASIA